MARLNFFATACFILGTVASDDTNMGPRSSAMADIFSGNKNVTVITVGRSPARTGSMGLMASNDRTHSNMNSMGSMASSDRAQSNSNGQNSGTIDFSTGWDLNRGINLFSLPSDSYISCRERCKNDSSCGAVVFLASPDGPSCYGKDTTQRRWSINPQSRALLMNSIDNQEHGDQWDINTSDIGLFSMNATTSYVACFDHCRDTPTCTAIVFNAYYNRCIGKSAASNSKLWSGPISSNMTAGTLMLDSGFDAAHSWSLTASS